jgi:hypothetical protein
MAGTKAEMRIAGLPSHARSECCSMQMIKSQPNPSNGKQESKSATVELEGCQAAGVMLMAK